MRWRGCGGQDSETEIWVRGIPKHGERGLFIRWAHPGIRASQNSEWGRRPEKWNGGRDPGAPVCRDASTGPISGAAFWPGTSAPRKKVRGAHATQAKASGEQSSIMGPTAPRAVRFEGAAPLQRSRISPHAWLRVCEIVAAEPPVVFAGARHGMSWPSGPTGARPMKPLRGLKTQGREEGPYPAQSLLHIGARRSEEVLGCVPNWEPSGAGSALGLAPKVASRTCTRAPFPTKSHRTFAATSGAFTLQPAKIRGCFDPAQPRALVTSSGAQGKLPVRGTEIEGRQSFDYARRKLDYARPSAFLSLAFFLVPPPCLSLCAEHAATGD